MKLKIILLIVNLLVNLLCFPAYAAPDLVKENALRLLKDLISYRSTAGRGQLKPMANYLRQQFLSGGFTSADIHFIDAEPDTGALIVRYRGDGLGGKPILLMAHMDVVDALPEDWTSPPFELTEKDGYLYGRGTLDNKGGVAALSATFLRMKAEGYTPKRDYILVITGDEETTANSIRAVVEGYPALIASEYALNSDAGGGEVNHEGKPLFYSLQAAAKTLPQKATATINCRVFPGISVKNMLADLKSVIDDNHADIKVLDNPRSSPASNLNPVLLDALTMVLKQLLPGVLLIPKMSSGATDAVETRAAGIPTYGVSGLTIGPDDHRAHGQDERIKKSAFFSSLDHWYLLLTELSGK